MQDEVKYEIVWHYIPIGEFTVSLMNRVAWKFKRKTKSNKRPQH